MTQQETSAKPSLQPKAGGKKPQHAARWRDVRDNEMHINGVPLSRLAARVGQTPFYAYDRSLIRQRIAALRRILPPSIKLHYAIKANPMPALVDYITPLVDGLDVASRLEMHTALNTGIDPAEISFAGPGKGESEIMSAVAAGIVLNIESFLQLRQAAEAGRQLGVIPRIALRLNPSCELKGSGMKMTGGAKPFGIDTEAFPELIRQVRDLGLEPEGLHLFTGSQNLNPAAICEAQSAMLELASQLIETHQLTLRFINIGGGFGIPYFPGEQHLDLQPIADNLSRRMETLSVRYPDTDVVIELGRYLVGEAGIYVSQVIDKKQSRGVDYLISNGGLHHHLSNSGNFGQVIRKNYPVHIGNRVTDPHEETVTIVGPLCTPLDILAQQMLLPPCHIADYVVILQSGAYGLSASPTAFLGQPQATEVLV